MLTTDLAVISRASGDVLPAGTPEGLLDMAGPESSIARHLAAEPNQNETWGDQKRDEVVSGRPWTYRLSKSVEPFPNVDP
jgi:hypothetical protein